MININPVTDLRNYTDVLRNVGIGAPVFLTKNGRGKYALVDIHDYAQGQSVFMLLNQLAEGRCIGDNDGWATAEEVLLKSGTPSDILVKFSPIVLSDMADNWDYCVNEFGDGKYGEEMAAEVVSTISKLTSSDIEWHALDRECHFRRMNVVSSYRYVTVEGCDIFYRIVEGTIFVDRILYHCFDKFDILP